MIDVVTKHWSEVFSFLCGLVGGGVAGSWLTFHFSQQRVRGSRNISVNQSGSTASGDIVGQNKITSTSTHSERNG